MTSATDNRTTELLPCPFCGGEAEAVHEISGFWTVECVKCGALVDGIDAWNTRHVETCEIESEFWNDHGGYDSDTYEWTLSCGHSVEWLDNEPPKHCPECGAKVVTA